MAKKLLMVLRKRKESGASMLEYALLAALIAIACVGAINVLSGSIQGTFSAVANSMA